MRRVFATDVSTSVLVWEEDDLLVEMYLMHPGAIVVPHSHPFENLAIHFSGKMLGRREGSIGEWLTDRHRGLVGNPLPSGTWHSFEVGSEGAIFYNVARFSCPDEKTSATLRYVGEPLGPRHKLTLDQLTSVA